MKLTIQLRKEITERATKKLRVAFDKAFKKAENYSLKKHALDYIGTSKERERMNKLPNGWMRTTSSLTFSLPSYDCYEYIFSDNGQIRTERVSPLRNLGTVQFKPNVRLPNDKSTYGMQAPEEFKKIFLNLVELHKGWQDTREQLYINLKQYKTLEDLCEAWPEGEEFTKNLSVRSVTTALAVRWSDINTKIAAD